MSTYYENTLYPLQDKVLKAIDILKTPFYLTGGTVLSRCYFHHRYSDDLDFFMNNDKQFQGNAEKIIEDLQPFDINVNLRSDTYYSLFVGSHLKVELVNDTGKHIGGFASRVLFSKIDTVENIISNKISAIYSRDEAKDVVDLWIIVKSQKIDWQKIFQDVASKASGIFPPLIAKRLETFPADLLNSILINGSQGKSLLRPYSKKTYRLLSRISLSFDKIYI